MKHVMLGLVVLIATFSLQAQVKTPQPSPTSKIEQTVGLTQIAVEYSRPSLRGRHLYGYLLPYGELWRTGANANTKVTFSDDVVIGGKPLKAGTYALYTKPDKIAWDIIFYKASDNWGLPKTWDASQVALETKSEVYPNPVSLETFTISFADLTNDSAVMRLSWGLRFASFKIEVPTDDIVMKDIERAMSGTTANDYYAAAVYYFESGKDIDQAKTWIDTCISMTENPAFYQLRKQSLIYAKAGDKEGAIAAAKKSLEAAKIAGNTDYIKMNTASLEEWGAL
ncbi:DUF2911 domain-containing protein [Formosa algae]|uniref:Tetratricopeptide (TPR) repeat protein n=1 Tax=Formosa algae TaxID=225843 RepID=A0A9X1C8V4_9FLAO|nr:DUF2911 domain-containing protein [Formosa algae]MBP1839941.1 tetratricopeptide (TPR) repeat protein [Formosa algae]MDQ0335540.1 tetratricopeptide (TPR) repeat protein [Formosa algae]OEI81759.1 dihydrolipoamide dehydrogenase [Formosa algae]